jgi:LCP family protein required for cell wall assembly
MWPHDPPTVDDDDAVVAVTRTARDDGSRPPDPPSGGPAEYVLSLADLERSSEPDGGPRRRLPTAWKAALGVAVMLALLFVGGAIGVRLTSDRVLSHMNRIPDVFAPIDQATRPQKPAGSEQTLNFLLVGVDTRAEEQTTGTGGDGEIFVPGRQRSDAIMIVHVSADRRAAWVVSIPRDSWVPVPDRGMAKINAAYSLGGPTLLVRTVEQLTDLRIDHFAVVDFAGFKDIVDAVGGIDVRVAASTGDHRGFFKAGVNHLGGEAALIYARQRYNLPNGDLDRVRRQQNVIKALTTKASSLHLLSSPSRALSVAGAVAQAVSVDDSLDDDEMRSLGLSLRHLKPAGVKFLTVPTSGLGREGAQSVVRLDAARSVELWQALRTDHVAAYVHTHPADTLGSNPR